MRDPKQMKRILSKLEQYWLLFPNMSLINMVNSVAFDPRGLVHVDDDTLEGELDKVLTQMKDRERKALELDLTASPDHNSLR